MIDILLFVVPSVLSLAIVAGVVLRRRIPIERRARALLAQFPDAERTSVYLAFHSCWPSIKQQEMNAKIAEMTRAGWTFLRGREANPVKTIRSWGGGVMLQFIRANDSKTRRAA